MSERLAVLTFLTVGIATVTAGMPGTAVPSGRAPTWFDHGAQCSKHGKVPRHLLPQSRVLNFQRNCLEEKMCGWKKVRGRWKRRCAGVTEGARVEQKACGWKRKYTSELTP